MSNLIFKGDYFISVNDKGTYRKYFHFENIFSITLKPSVYQGLNYEEAQKKHGLYFWGKFLENRIIFKSIYNNAESELVYGWEPEDIAECNSDFEKIIKAHAKYNRNKTKCLTK